jgi:phage-related protein
MESTFKELLVLCRGDLTEITNRLNQIAQSEAGEDNLRKEIIDQGRKMNELREDHERQVYELTRSHNDKIQ